MVCILPATGSQSKTSFKWNEQIKIKQTRQTRIAVDGDPQPREKERRVDLERTEERRDNRRDVLVELCARLISKSNK